MPERLAVAASEGLRQQIADRAYVLWEQEGRPDGRDVDHWLRAEAEIAVAANDRPKAPVPAASRAKKPEKAAAD